MQIKTKLQSSRIVILSGSGISAESGLPTFRDSLGLWKSFSWKELASPQGWKTNTQAVLEFYNVRRAHAWSAQPNEAHKAIASLEKYFDVIVVTQNVDDLHERAGSSKVIHLHGQLTYARGTGSSSRRYRVDGAPITIGQLCEDGTQLRPDIVWFGEQVQFFDQAYNQIEKAEKILVVGTSLSVFPAASLVNAASRIAEKVIVYVDHVELPVGFTSLIGKATEIVPVLVEKWIREI